jgi:hypothetical protein
MRNFAPVPARLPERWDDNPKSVWQVQCKCGGAIGRLLGHSLKVFNSEYDGPLLLISPLAFQCASCERPTELLDTDIHGYHADLDLREGTTGRSCKFRGSGERLAFPCPACSADLFTIVVGFVFWDAEELEEEFEDRWEDLFNVFLCYTSCVKCGAMSRPADFGKL